MTMTPKQIADKIVPEYASGKFSCTSRWAKRWNTAFEAAKIGLEQGFDAGYEIRDNSGCPSFTSEFEEWKEKVLK